MTNLYRILFIVFVVLSAVLVYVVVRQSRSRVDYLASEVSADSIASYERRADSLDQVAGELQTELARLKDLPRLSVQRRLDNLRKETATLRTAIERWRAARTPNENNQAYRECILLYGKATAICQGLETDLPADTGR